MAKCPAHPDRHPSLSIDEGKKVPIVLCCMSHGCETKAILAALGLHWRDLYDDKPFDREAMRAVEMERRRQEMEEKDARVTRGLWISQAYFWEEEVRRIGKLLESDFDSDTLARQLHRALEKGRTAQSHVRSYFHPCNVPGEIAS